MSRRNFSALAHSLRAACAHRHRLELTLGDGSRVAGVPDRFDVEPLRADEKPRPTLIVHVADRWIPIDTIVRVRRAEPRRSAA